MDSLEDVYRSTPYQIWIVKFLLANSVGMRLKLYTDFQWWTLIVYTWTKFNSGSTLVIIPLCGLRVESWLTYEIISFPQNSIHFFWYRWMHGNITVDRESQTIDEYCIQYAICNATGVQLEPSGILIFFAIQRCLKGSGTLLVRLGKDVGSPATEHSPIKFWKALISLSLGP